MDQKSGDRAAASAAEPPAAEAGVGETGWEAKFFSPEEEGSSLELTVFRNGDGYVSYEIKENDDYLAYGDVNEGDVEDATGMRRRRRRLLQGGGHHGS